MKNCILLPALFLVLMGCSDGEDLQPMDLRRASAMNVYCHSAPEVLMQRAEYAYYNGNLVAETIFNGGDIYSETTYTYDSEGQLTSESYLTSGLKLDKTFVYNALGQLVNVHHNRTDYDLNGQVVSESESEAPREYEQNRLVKEWESWGGFNTYEYENGKMVVKTDYNGLGEKHHITTYAYSGSLLVQLRNICGIIKMTKIRAKPLTAVDHAHALLRKQGYAPGWPYCSGVENMAAIWNGRRIALMSSEKSMASIGTAGLS